MINTAIFCPLCGCKNTGTWILDMGYSGWCGTSIVSVSSARNSLYADNAWVRGTCANGVNGWICTFGSHCSGFLEGGSNTLYDTCTSRWGTLGAAPDLPSLSGGGRAGHQFDGITTSATQTPSSPSGIQRPFNGVRFVPNETCNKTQIFCRCKWPLGSAPAWKSTRTTGESLGIVLRTKCAEISKCTFDCWRSSRAAVAFCTCCCNICSGCVISMSGTMYRAGTVCFVENGP